MTAALALVGVAVGTWVLRVGFVTIVDVDILPAAVRESLDYVGPAVMVAIVIMALADGQGGAGLRPTLAEIVGLLAAGVVARRSNSLPWSLVAAMAAFTAVGLLTSP